MHKPHVARVVRNSHAPAQNKEANETPPAPAAPALACPGRGTMTSPSTATSNSQLPVYRNWSAARTTSPPGSPRWGIWGKSMGKSWSHSISSWFLVTKSSFLRNYVLNSAENQCTVVKYVIICIYNFISAKPWNPWIDRLPGCPKSAEHRPGSRRLPPAIQRSRGRRHETWRCCDFFLGQLIWVCLKMGYTPNYSHLVGIMISKTIG